MIAPRDMQLSDRDQTERLPWDPTLPLQRMYLRPSPTPKPSANGSTGLQVVRHSRMEATPGIRGKMVLPAPTPALKVSLPKFVFS